MCNVIVRAVLTQLTGFTIRSMMSWDMENRKQLPDFYFPFCWLFGKWDVENRTQLASRFPSSILWLFVKVKLTSQSLQHWRQIGHKKPLSVWPSTVTLETGTECWPNCTTVRITLQLYFWILQNVVQISFFMSLWSWVLLLLCNVEYLSEKKTGMATNKGWSLP